jgi:hypothetical protein
LRFVRYMRYDVETAIGDTLPLPYGIREWSVRRMLAVLHTARRHMLTMHESARMYDARYEISSPHGGGRSLFLLYHTVFIACVQVDSTVYLCNAVQKSTHTVWYIVFVDKSHVLVRYDNTVQTRGVRVKCYPGRHMSGGNVNVGRKCLAKESIQPRSVRGNYSREEFWLRL